MRCPDPDADADRVANTDPDTYTNANTDADTNANPDTNTNANPDADTNSNPDADTNANPDTNTNTVAESVALAYSVDALSSRQLGCRPRESRGAASALIGPSQPHDETTPTLSGSFHVSVGCDERQRRPWV